ncbi:hypothetical protein [Aquisphaera insulae]|uniref:hypothetical protein n=1 Tax=Aquisphaera insulae TaxID=2712864 RepID=UPI0013EB3609|nr:hypothetical protein [Aquisphaera insulae]
MDRGQLVDLLWYRTWYAYSAGNPPWIEIPYHVFNLFEGAAWCLFAALVLRRYLIHRRSWLELAYALAFLTFGMTDFREAYSLQTWLLWIKGLNLAILLGLRAHILGRYYPGEKLY